MAASGGGFLLNKEPSGYPLNIFKDNVDPKYLCGHCKKILRNPLQSYCGHRFCKDCMQYLMTKNEGKAVMCSSCKMEELMTEYSQLSLEQTFPDNALKREFFSLSCQCPFDKCPWTGSFKDFEMHYVHCEFIPKKSDNSDIDNKFLAENIIKLHKKLSSNEEIVGQLKNKVEKIEQTHQRLEIESKKLISKNVEEGSSVASAVAVAGREGGAAIDSENIHILVKKKEDEFKLIEGIFSVLSQELDLNKEKLDGMSRQEKLTFDLKDRVEKKSIEIEKIMSEKDFVISELETRVLSLDQTSYDGTLIWKISNIQQKRRDAINGSVTSLYSPAFYTSKTGYKMCSRIYLNGDGQGKGSHVSLFFVIMRGPNDALLKWPFRQKVTLVIIDQNNKENVVDSFRPDPTSSSFKRPTGEMNTASGCPLFTSLTTLDNTMNAYVKDNLMFVKIVINCEGLD